MCGVDPVISKSSHGINEKTYRSIYTKKGNSNKFAIPKIKKTIAYELKLFKKLIITNIFREICDSKILPQ